jgi:hypothetical protein
MGRPGFILQHVIDLFAVQPQAIAAGRSPLGSVWLAFISEWKGSFQAARFNKRTSNSNVENESRVCPIGAA